MDALVVDVVHFDPKENAKAHRTDKFELVHDDVPRTTIVRRGQPFSGVIHFDRPYDGEKDLVQLVFNVGKKRSMETRGSIYIRHDAQPDKNLWTARITNIRDKSLMFEVTSPITAPVGVWSLSVVTRLKDSPAREVYDFNQDIYILFNPWNPDDQTYMEDSSLLEEYVLSDVGKIWICSARSARGAAWCFGQFDAVVLPACMFMLDRAGLSYQKRGDPIKLTRCISQIVNSDNDNGVMTSRWEGPLESNYDDGTAPWDWTGSVDILRQYLETQKPVRYGQCWVFAGVVNTVCRALGIPCRVVTNLVSAYDANKTLSVDIYYTKTMKELEYDPTNSDEKDSIWNFHAWNDAWMARPDLPTGFGGWQAIDATPQETSQGLYQCGPASVEAIKQGYTGFGYDVEFMLASVNADIMRWRVDPDAEFGYSVVRTETYKIGRNILTKKPFLFKPLDDSDCDDITAQYKFREGTTSERLALMNGVLHSDRAKRYYGIVSSSSRDVTFKLRDIDTVPIGEDFEVAVDIKNSSNEGRSISATLLATSVYYNGVKAGLVKGVENEIYVGPNNEDQLRFVVKADEYLPMLVEYCNIKISAMAIVEETKQAWADNDDFCILQPNIKITMKDNLVLNQTSLVTLSLQNPLTRPLTGCEFRLTSSEIAEKTLRVQTEDVVGMGSLNTEIRVLPNKLGKINFVATFKSVELKDIRGAASAEVLKST